MGAAGGWFLAHMVARLSDATVALVTFLLAIGGMEVFENWESVTGGRTGIGGLPSISISDFDISPKATAALVLILTFSAIFLLVRFLFSSQFGRAIRALRDDAAGAELDGINAFRVERDVLMLFGFNSALIGALWAFALPRVIPEYFDFAVLTLPVVLACILGGGEKPHHCLLGAALVLALDEAAQRLPVPPEIRADIPLLVVGITYVAVALAGGPSGLARKLARFVSRFRNNVFQPSHGTVRAISAAQEGKTSSTTGGRGDIDSEKPL
jgi:ABC-type branched-subunit amino acid transport system permease subunit